jgi:hypothetical protein
MLTIFIMPTVKDKSLKERSDCLWCCLLIDAALVYVLLPLFHH